MFVLVDIYVLLDTFGSRGIALFSVVLNNKTFGRLVSTGKVNLSLEPSISETAAHFAFVSGCGPVSTAA